MRTLEQRRELTNLRDLDDQSLGAAYDTYAGIVYRYIRYRLNDDRAAEDILGEVFLSMLEALRRGTGPQTNVKAWLLATAGHIVTDHLRRSYRRPTEELNDEHPDRAPTPGEQYEEAERRREFKRAYSQLTAEQQHVLALRFGEGFTLEETAAVIKKNVNAVKALQFRAVQALQRNLGEATNG
jgi:RNA polymerase sigma-70 factor (ECF subfamily)